MADDPAQRASDSERESVADRLRTAAAEGRLDPDELDERVGQVYAARTHGELARLTADLPVPAPAPAPPESPWKSEELRRRFAGFLVPNVICNAIWLATGAGYWWPVWVLLGTGIGLLVTVIHVALGVERR
jgi:Domain of unknown function (DUF1707)